MSTVQKEKGKKTLRIFLSYTTADKVQAHKLRGLLSQRPGLRIFTADTLSAGEDWVPKLRDELSQCDIFMVLLSPDSVDSDWILQELGAAWALNKPVIPIVTHRDMFSKIPLTLREVMSVGLEELEDPEVIDRILERYEKMAESHE